MPTLGFKGENAREKVVVLLTMCFALAMAMLDNTVVNVAVPSIQRDLGVGLSELQWIVTGYALSFAALMLTGGKLADMLGRRRIFVIGIVIFNVSSFDDMNGIGSVMSGMKSVRLSPRPSTTGSPMRAWK